MKGPIRQAMQSHLPAPSSAGANRPATCSGFLCVELGASCMRNSSSAFKYIWREATRSLWHHTSHQGGTTRLAPRKPRPLSPPPQAQGTMVGLGSCRNNVPAHFGSRMGSKKAPGSLGNSCLNGATGKKPAQAPQLHEGARSWWGSGRAEGYVMLGSRSGCPRCSPVLPAPHLQTPGQRRLLARELHLRWLHLANSPPKHSPQTEPTTRRSAQWFKQKKKKKKKKSSWHVTPTTMGQPCRLYTLASSQEMGQLPERPELMQASSLALPQPGKAQVRKHRLQ